MAAVEVLGARAEPAEVDDPFHPGRGRGLGEVRRAFLVAGGEVAVAAPPHRVDEVVGDLGPLERRAERVGLEDVGPRTSQPASAQVAGALRIAGQRPHLLAFLSQALAEQPADVAGAPATAITAPTYPRAERKPSRQP